MSAEVPKAPAANKGAQRLRNLLGLATRPRPPVGATPVDVVHAENKWRLLRYRSETRRWQTPVLLVPSLINRHYVLDLTPGKSLVEFLLSAGHDVLVIDWGTPGDEDRFVTFEDVTLRWLGRAIRKSAALTSRNQVHVLGYCMGGTLAAIHAAVDPRHVASLVALAAPVRFDGCGILGAWTQAPGFDVGTLIDACGNVPWQLLQGAFQLLRPTLGLAKAVNLIDRAWNDRYLDGHLALETWAGDNVSLPGEFYRTWIQDLYRADALQRGTLTLGGHRVDLGAIALPLLAVTFDQDAIAPAADCALLVERAASVDKQVLAVTGSHVGGVTSREASKSLWPVLSSWWSTRDVAVQHEGRQDDAAVQQARTSRRPPRVSRA
jgi:polyhydroxyalkanoate synthase